MLATGENGAVLHTASATSGSFANIHFRQFSNHNPMKKRFALILIAVFALVAAFAATSTAFADEQHNANYVPAHKKYGLSSSLDSDGKVYGAAFSGVYFGSSGIQVVVEIYSSDALKLDFYLGDGNLSEQQAQNKQKLLDLAETIHALITKVDECANTSYDGSGNLPCSDIWRYNQAKQGDRLEISVETYEMLQLAKEMYAETDGAFNPAVYRLVDLWGFSSRIYQKKAFDKATYPYDRPVTPEYFVTNGYPLPDEEYVKAFSQSAFTDFSDDAVTLTQDGDSYYVTKNVAPVVVDGVEYGQWLDLGGVAKGFVVDEITQLLRKNDIYRYYVDAGSSSSSLGLDASGNSSTITLADPFAPYSDIYVQELFSYETGVATLSTSGQYVRKYVTDGVEYSHIIDGTTGAPAQTGVKMVSVTVPQTCGLWAGKGDCLTTALTVMGKDRIVEFVNGYLKEQGITVVVLFETFDGKREICSNLPKSKVKSKGAYFDNYAWTLSQDETGNYFYDAEATFGKDSKTSQTVAIVLGSVSGASLLFYLVYYCIKHKTSALQKVVCARADKPFKAADVGVYMLVALLIAVLFGVFFSQDQSRVQTVKVTDISTGEELFLYNLVRNEYKFDGGTNGWQMQMEYGADSVTATFYREIDGEMRKNVLEITRGSNPTVKMVDSVCGAGKDCVRNFSEISKGGGVIVCSPNRLKVTTE